MSLSTTNSSTSRSYTTSLLPTNEEWKEMTKLNYGDSEDSVKALWSIIDVISTILEGEKTTGALGKLIEEENSINTYCDQSPNFSSTPVSTDTSSWILVDDMSEQNLPNKGQTLGIVQGEMSSDGYNLPDDSQTPIHLKDFVGYIQQCRQSQL
ncbi:hypothetical protein M231_05819 [Tremella mesenterica]|uniref:Uncharacterized protein n=1 Tax=Tremella mesenterica TaxID=5217 RepID=A0A4V1M3H8_TREME|nr:hypothetical protein M231_05819 [Tremella mesenterica]